MDTCAFYDPHFRHYLTNLLRLVFDDFARVSKSTVPSNGLKSETDGHYAMKSHKLKTDTYPGTFRENSSELRNIYKYIFAVS